MMGGGSQTKVFHVTGYERVVWGQNSSREVVCGPGCMFRKNKTWSKGRKEQGTALRERTEGVARTNWTMCTCEKRQRVAEGQRAIKGGGNLR